MSELLRAGEELGRYRIVRLLGQGGMGAVYEAVHTALKKRFAIKTLLPAIAQLPEARARFLREGEAASRINHPNVVAVSDVGTEGDMPYLVMEFLEGRSLDALLIERGRLEIAETIDIMLPVISAAAAGHDQGVIHRDLKPANIFLARGNWGGLVPKVLDFGVSKMAGGESAAMTGTLAVLGTAAYMSPEQARGARDVDARSDQYALGAILYEMLTGVRAHAGDSPLAIIHFISHQPLVPPRDLNPGLPQALVAVLMRMLAKAPEDRHPTLSAVGRALLPFAGDDTRAALRNAFREAEAVRAVARTLVYETQPEPEPAPAPAAGIGSTRLLHAEENKAPTTLGQSASAIDDRTEHARRRRRSVVAIGAGLAAIAAGAVGVALVAGHGPPPRVERAGLEERPPPAATDRPAVKATPAPDAGHIEDAGPSVAPRAAEPVEPKHADEAAQKKPGQALNKKTSKKTPVAPAKPRIKTNEDIF